MANIIEKAAQGNLKAMQAIYEKYRGRIYHLCMRLTGSMADANTVTADSFKELWGNLADGKFTAEEAAAAYLLLFAAKGCCSIIFGSNYPSFQKVAEADPVEEITGWTAFDGNIKLSLNCLGSAMGVLDKQQRIPLELLFCGLDTDSIAEVLGIGETAARDHVAHSLYLLKDELAVMEEEGYSGVPKLSELASLYMQAAERTAVSPMADVEVYRHIEAVAKPGFSPALLVIPIAALALCLAVMAAFALSSELKDESASDLETVTETSAENITEESSEGQ